MIARLSGVVEERNDEALVVDVQGVGYRVHMSTLALQKAPAVGAQVKLRIRTVVREDAFDLFGFHTVEEEALFQLLTTVSGVGPRVALGILSGIEVGELAEAIRSANLTRLKSVHGVGKKTAERLVVELRDKIGSLGGKGLGPVPNLVRPAGMAGDLISALVNLGYKPAAAERAAEQAMSKLGEGASMEGLLREALRAVRS
jgi:Holliday junction DNA helicase RuvA